MDRFIWFLWSVVTMLYLAMISYAFFVFDGSGDFIFTRSIDSAILGMVSMYSFIYILFVYFLIKFLRGTK